MKFDPEFTEHSITAQEPSSLAQLSLHIPASFPQLFPLGSVYQMHAVHWIIYLFIIMRDMYGVCKSQGLHVDVIGELFGIFSLPPFM